MTDKHPLDGLLEPASAPYTDASLVSIATSLKRIADAYTSPLVEMPLRHGGTAHIRPSQVASVSAHGQYPLSFVHIVGNPGNPGNPGFIVTLSLDETIKKLFP